MGGDWVSLLHKISTRRSTTKNLNCMLEQILDAAIAVTGANFGAIQIINPKTRDIDIVVHRNLPQWWLDYWQVASKGHPTLGIAIRTGQRVIVEDVTDTPALAGKELELVLDLGARSGHSTPLVTGFSHCVGMLSTMSRREGSPTPEQLVIVDILASKAASLIERVMVENRLREAIAAREDVLAVVAHDLRNPLTTITMQTQLMFSLKDENAKRLADGIKRSVSRIEKMTANLLEAAHIDNGAMPLSFAAVNLPQLLSAVVESQRLIVHQNDLSIELRIVDELPEIDGDMSRIAQVLENLIGNAIKFSAGGGKITVKAMQSAREVLFSIEDAGIGIEAADIKHVFDRFWQAKRRHGSGLGLAIAKGIVEAHKGKIWVKSQRGLGSTFFFTLPVKREEITKPE